MLLNQFETVKTLLKKKYEEQYGCITYKRNVNSFEIKVFKGKKNLLLQQV